MYLILFMSKSLLKITAIPVMLFGASYLQKEYRVVETLKNVSSRVAYIADSLNLTDYKRGLFNEYYADNCDGSESLVCRSVDPNGPMLTYSVSEDPDTPKDVYFSQLEGIRNNAGMREAAKLILENGNNSSELVLHYPFVGSHVAFLDMLLEFAKSDKLNSVKFILSEDSKYIADLQPILFKNIKNVLNSNNISDYNINGRVISFKFKTLAVKIELKSQEYTNSKSQSDVCIVHDPGAFEGSNSFQNICSSNIAVTSKDRMEGFGGIGLAGQKYKTIEGNEPFDHGHCIYSIKGGQLFKPEERIDGNKLVFVEFQ